LNCTSPYVVDSVKGGALLELPCGRCLQCRIARARVWATRCVHESAFHESNAFITLTYNDENLPADKSISKDELQRFFKRLRKNLDYFSGRKIKYFACGEYGQEKDKFGIPKERPHYHAIIFGISPWGEDKEEVREAWGRGFIYTGTVTYDSARYVAEYINTDYDGALGKSVYGKRKSPFKISSNGLGKSFAILEKEKIKKGLGITVRGNHVSVPRYYREKAGVSDSEKLRIAELGEMHNLDVYKKTLDKLSSQGLAKSDSDVLNAIVESRMQRTRNKKAKAAMRAKGKL